MTNILANRQMFIVDVCTSDFSLKPREYNVARYKIQIHETRSSRNTLYNIKIYTFHNFWNNLYNCLKCIYRHLMHFQEENLQWMK